MWRTAIEADLRAIAMSGLLFAGPCVASSTSVNRQAPAQELAEVSECSGTVLKPDEVELEFIAHACFRIRSPGGKRILIDPYASRVWIGYDFPECISADALLITHPHYDHDGGRRIGADVRWMEKLQVIDQPGAYQVGTCAFEGSAANMRTLTARSSGRSTRSGSSRWPPARTSRRQRAADTGQRGGARSRGRPDGPDRRRASHSLAA